MGHRPDHGQPGAAAHAAGVIGCRPHDSGSPPLIPFGQGICSVFGNASDQRSYTDPQSTRIPLGTRASCGLPPLAGGLSRAGCPRSNTCALGRLCRSRRQPTRQPPCTPPAGITPPLRGSRRGKGVARRRGGGGIPRPLCQFTNSRAPHPQWMRPFFPPHRFTPTTRMRLSLHEVPSQHTSRTAPCVVGMAPRRSSAISPSQSEVG